MESIALSRIKPSATVAMLGVARALMARGEKVISLGGGEPDFDTPSHIKEAAIRAIRSGKTKYTDVDGIPELKAAVCAKLWRENQLKFGLEQISVGPGAKSVIFNALLATLSPGDEVIIPAPYWVSYPEMVSLAGGVPVIVPTLPCEGFKLDPAVLEAAITSRTKWLILNSPGNPSGATYSDGELRGLADVLIRHRNVWILSDDIYEHLVFGGGSFRSIANIDESLLDRTLMINGVSKAYAMTGWRIGYGAGPPPLIRAMAKVMGQSTSNPCSISQWAAVAALNGPQAYIPSSRKEFELRRDVVVSKLNQVPGLSCPTPQGAFYVFPSCEALLGKTGPSGKIIANDEDFVAELLTSERIAVVHGSAFGTSGQFRLSFTSDLETLSDACDGIARFCARLLSV